MIDIFLTFDTSSISFYFRLFKAGLPTIKLNFPGRAPKKAGLSTIKLNFPGRAKGRAPKNDQPEKIQLIHTSPRVNATECRGVRELRGVNRFEAEITIDHKKHHLGYFGTAKKAAIAWDLAAIQAKRPRSDLNFPEEIPKRTTNI